MLLSHQISNWDSSDSEYADNSLSKNVPADLNEVLTHRERDLNKEEG